MKSTTLGSAWEVLERLRQESDVSFPPRHEYSIRHAKHRSFEALADRSESGMTSRMQAPAATVNMPSVHGYVTEARESMDELGQWDQVSDGGSTREPPLVTYLGMEAIQSTSGEAKPRTSRPSSASTGAGGTGAVRQGAQNTAVAPGGVMTIEVGNRAHTDVQVREMRAMEGVVQIANELGALPVATSQVSVGAKFSYLVQQSVLPRLFDLVRLRNDMYMNDEIRVYALKMWLRLVKTDGSGIPKARYIAICESLQQSLLPSQSDKERRIAAKNDWLVDSQGTSTVEFEAFFLSIFQLLSVWNSNNNPTAIIESLGAIEDVLKSEGFLDHVPPSGAPSPAEPAHLIRPVFHKVLVRKTREGMAITAPRITQRPTSARSVASSPGRLGTGGLMNVLVSKSRNNTTMKKFTTSFHRVAYGTDPAPNDHPAAAQYDGGPSARAYSRPLSATEVRPVRHQPSIPHRKSPSQAQQRALVVLGPKQTCSRVARPTAPAHRKPGRASGTPRAPARDLIRPASAAPRQARPGSGVNKSKGRTKPIRRPVSAGAVLGPGRAKTGRKKKTPTAPIVEGGPASVPPIDGDDDEIIPSDDELSVGGDMLNALENGRLLPLELRKRGEAMFHDKVVTLTHAEAARAGEVVPLSLSGPIPGSGLVGRAVKMGDSVVNTLLVGVEGEALVGRMDSNGHLCLEGAYSGWSLDLHGDPHGRIQVNISCDGATQAFVIGDDGSISPAHHPDMVFVCGAEFVDLGVQSPSRFSIPKGHIPGPAGQEVIVYPEVSDDSLTYVSSEAGPRSGHVSVQGSVDSRPRTTAQMVAGYERFITKQSGAKVIPLKETHALERLIELRSQQRKDLDDIRQPAARDVDLVVDPIELPDQYSPHKDLPAPDKLVSESSTEGVVDDIRERPLNTLTDHEREWRRKTEFEEHWASTPYFKPITTAAGRVMPEHPLTQLGEHNLNYDLEAQALAAAKTDAELRMKLRMQGEAENVTRANKTVASSPKKKVSGILADPSEKHRQARKASMKEAANAEADVAATGEAGAGSVTAGAFSSLLAKGWGYEKMDYKVINVGTGDARHKFKYRFDDGVMGPARASVAERISNINELTRPSTAPSSRSPQYKVHGTSLHQAVQSPVETDADKDSEEGSPKKVARPPTGSVRRINAGPRAMQIRAQEAIEHAKAKYTAQHPEMDTFVNRVFKAGGRQPCEACVHDDVPGFLEDPEVLREHKPVERDDGWVFKPKINGVRHSLEDFDGNNAAKMASTFRSCEIFFLYVLRKGTTDQRLCAAECMRRLDISSFYKDLIATLRDPEPALRCKILECLRDIRQPSDIRFMIAEASVPLLNDEEPTVRAVAAECLAACGFPEYAKDIAALLTTESNSRVVRGVVDALSVLGCEQEDIAKAIPLLTRPACGVSGAVEKMLVRLAPKNFPLFYDEVVAECKAAMAAKTVAPWKVQGILDQVQEATVKLRIGSRTHQYTRQDYASQVKG